MKPSSPLSEAFLKAMRGLLIEARARITGDTLSEESLRPSEDTGATNHPAEFASDNFEQELNLGLLEDETAWIKEIDEAMDRIDGRGYHTYGLCEACADEPKNLCPGCPWITEGRLRQIPWARHCTAIQEILDREGEG